MTATTRVAADTDNETTGRNARPLRLITCGSVDDGKSTLIGRLLWDTKAVKDDQADALERDNRNQQNGLGLPDFALLLDGLQAGEQVVTAGVFAVKSVMLAHTIAEDHH